MSVLVDKMGLTITWPSTEYSIVTPPLKTELFKADYSNLKTKSWNRHLVWEREKFQITESEDREVSHNPLVLALVLTTGTSAEWESLVWRNLNFAGMVYYRGNNLISGIYF